MSVLKAMLQLLSLIYRSCTYVRYMSSPVRLSVVCLSVVDLLLVTIEHFSLRVTTEAIRAKIDRKSAISPQRGQFDPKFQVEWVAPTNHFCTDIYANGLA